MHKDNFIDNIPRELFRGFRVALNVCEMGNGTGGRNGNAYKLGASLLHGREIFNFKNNCLKTHPFLAQFSSYPFLHAESYCLISHGIDHCKGYDLYVVRLRKDNSIGSSKPCEVCQKLIKLAAIRYCFYTNSDGSYEQL